MFSFMVRLGLWCLTPLSTIFQLYRQSKEWVLILGKSIINLLMQGI